MAQYNITATSAKANNNAGMTVSNTDTKRHPSPAEFETQELAQKSADKYAKSLCHQDHEGTWDWVGHATPV
jgi:hypothetical protein